MIRTASLLALVAVTLLTRLASADTPPPAPTAPAPIPGFPPFQLPQVPWPPGMPPLPGAPAAQPAAAPGGPTTAPGPMLGILFGPQAWQAEVRAVINELIANLSPDKQALVQGIPLIFDPNPNTINAFAGCDEKGSPFLAGTEGLLEAIDAISQTVANDDLYGTHTYDQYASTVMPRLVQANSSSPALPLGIIPFNTVLDPRRISHAHELFDNIVAFTFGHELAHHYRGHTGCARAGGAPASPMDPSQLLRYGSRVPVFNQTLETDADTFGCINTLDAGRSRRPNFQWNERGAMLMLDFFSRMDRQAGVSPLNPGGFLQTHPHPALRIPVVQFVAQGWHQTHPG